MNIISRRGLLAGVSIFAIGSRVSSWAQPPKTPRIGWITAQQEASLAPYLEALRTGLREQGFVEGQNIQIEYRYGDGDLTRVPALARELSALPVDVIVAQGAAAFEVLKLNLPRPLVYVISADPVSAGFADSLAQPRGNATGLTFMAFEFAAKRIELLRELVPDFHRVAVVGNPEHPGSQLERAYSEERARQLNVTIDYHPTTTREALTKAFGIIEKEKPQAISLLADGFAIQNRQTVIDFAMKQTIPVISGWPVFAQSGALCTYGPRQSESYRRLAYFIARVLHGSKPAELPVERPTKFEMVINLKTAKILRLPISRAVLARADQIIE